MKKRFIIILFVSLIYSLFAQNPPDTLWTKTYGGSEDEIARSMQVTNDGGYIITGDIGQYHSSEILLIKTDQDGNTIWEHSFGDQYHDGAYSVIQTLDGGYIIAGDTNRAEPNFYDAWLIKLDQDGNVIWDSTYGGEGSDKAMSIIQLDDGNFVIVGSSTSYSTSYFDAWLFKIDQDGNLEWQRTYSGYANDNGTCLQLTSDGGFIIAGGREVYGSGIDVLLIKTDQNGILMWENIFDINDFDFARSILQTEDGGYILAGLSEIDSTSNYDALLIKVDQDGELEWYNTYGGSEDEMTFSVLQTDESEYIVTGFTGSYGAGNKDVWLFKTDQDGNMIWDVTFGGGEEDIAYSIQNTNDDGFIIAGFTRSYGAGNKDAYLIRLSSEVGVNDPFLLNVINQPNLNQNHPNPFNPTTTISHQLPEDSKISLSIFNIKGQKVKTLVKEILPAGEHSVIWNGRDSNGNRVCSGVYFYKLKAGDFQKVKKMLLVK